MNVVRRFIHNPILSPDLQSDWEAEGAFNGCPVKSGDDTFLLYRAASRPLNLFGAGLSLSTIGIAKSRDGFHFGERKQLVKPEFPWEKFGCEDPRVTKFRDKFYIFYTALSSFPFGPNNIKVGVALTHDLSKIEEKHPVTTFNAKATMLFPDTVGGKMAAIVTANTDYPPSKIALAVFDREEDIWSKDYWYDWYMDLPSHTIHLQKSHNDHIEAGAPPLKTPYGWIFVYSYIYNYFTGGRKVFAVEAALLDLNNPQKIIGRTSDPLIVPEKHYELFGKVPNIVFPTGALVDEENLDIYYGAADTTTAVATVRLEDLMLELHPESRPFFIKKSHEHILVERYKHNPVIQAVKDHEWESYATFNPAAVYAEGKVFILYRTNDDWFRSYVGLGISNDGLRIDERLTKPVYWPREEFEVRNEPGNSGCEDGRVVKIGDRFYMTYTAYNGYSPPRAAITSISVSDFVNRRWSRWSTPKLISPPGIDDKNCTILPEKISGKYVFYHRLQPCIWMDFVESLEFPDGEYLSGKVLMQPRVNSWDSEKIGIGGPVLKTEDGWLMIYHGVSKKDYNYRLGAALFSLDNPLHLLARLDYPILEPLTWYENSGQRAGTCFACGNIIKDGQVFIYYGGADQNVCVGTVELKKLLKELKKFKI